MGSDEDGFGVVQDEDRSEPMCLRCKVSLSVTEQGGDGGLRGEKAGVMIRDDLQA